MQFVLIFLIVLFSLILYYLPNTEQFAADMITPGQIISNVINPTIVAIPKSSEKKNSDTKDEVLLKPNKFQEREIQISKLRSTIQREELPEQSMKNVSEIKQKDRQLDDDIFKDTIMYENKENKYSGVEKCLDECSGRCVEYGYTNNAICFPIT